MSTIVTSNISDGTNTVGTEYVVNGSAKSWVNFNGTGTIATRDSLNISGLTDNGEGDYTLSFSTNFSSVNYTPASGTVGAPGVSRGGLFVGPKATALQPGNPQSNSINTSNCIVGVSRGSGANGIATSEDSDGVYMSFVGDLA